jgi:hypothetical protein
MNKSLLSTKILCFVALSSCGSVRNESGDVSQTSKSTSKDPTFICFDKKSEKQLIKVKQTQNVVHLRPSGEKVYQVEVTISNRLIKGLGSVTRKTIDVVASDKLLGDIQLKARPGNDQDKFNALAMLGDVKPVVCLENLDKKSGPERI